jgi:hypothetical protein
LDHAAFCRVRAPEIRGEPEQRVRGINLRKHGKRQRGFDRDHRAVSRFATRVFVNELPTLRKKGVEVGLQRAVKPRLARAFPQIVKPVEHATLHPAEGLQRGGRSQRVKKRRRRIGRTFAGRFVEQKVRGPRARLGRQL